MSDSPHDDNQDAPRRGSASRFRLIPPPGTLTLIVLHLIGFGVVNQLSRVGSDAAVISRLGNSTMHPAGILLHPFGDARIGVLLLVVFLCGMLGGRIEIRFGKARLLATYAAGTILSGLFYFVFAQFSPDHAGVELAVPVGALGAWTLGARRGMKSVSFGFPGMSTSFAKGAALIDGAIGLVVFFLGGPPATGWLLAGVIGSLAWPIYDWFRVKRP